MIPLAIALAVGTMAGGSAARTSPADAQVRYLDPGQLPDEWRTRAERTDYAETARYDETVAFCRKLADFSPYAYFTDFGASGEGRPLPLLILSRGRNFTPARNSNGRPRVLLQSCIHAGECEGKDASLALARDILVTGERANLLNGADLLIMPIFNVDGHERFGPHNRLNQNGPREMGWRVTAINLNLNRDYMKADAVEMQCWLRFWTAWQPDVFIDSHTTDGSDCQYDLFYAATTGPELYPGIAAWTRQAWLPDLLAGLAADGHLALEYSFARDERDPAKGFVIPAGATPRYSHGYGALCNRPTMLVEAHALKPYRTRVRATYSVIQHALEAVNRHADELRAAIRAADSQAVAARGAAADGTIPLRWKLADESRPIVYRGLEQTVRPSAITGSDIIQYGTRPVDIETTLSDGARVDKSVTPPAAYMIPPQWTEVISRLDLHGVEYFRLSDVRELEVRTYRFREVKFPARSFESRFLPKFEVAAGEQVQYFPAGSVVVPMNQARARIAAGLLEPEAPDSLLAWGFFNAIFEQKEYAEDYIFEPVAQRMLEQHAELRAAFEERLKDTQFAGDPHARLNFFYERSPYWDAALNLYPVGLCVDEEVLRGLR